MEKNTEAYLSELKIANVQAVTKLKQNVLLLHLADDEKRVLKTKRKSGIKSWIDDHRFYNELRIYKHFAARQFGYLKPPAFLPHSNDYFLIQYLERCEEVRLADVDKAEFINAYIELQNIAPGGGTYFNWKHQILRGFFYQFVVVSLLSLRKRLGLKKIFKVISLFFSLQAGHKKLNRKYWLHGDLTSNNVFYNKIDEKLYFIDFENMFYTRKWVLHEIIENCFTIVNDRFRFDDQLLKFYMASLANTGGFEKINLKKQIQFSALSTCLTNIVATKDQNKKATFLKFLDVVVSKSEFNRWYDNNVHTKKGTNNLKFEQPV